MGDTDVSIPVNLGVTLVPIKAFCLGLVFDGVFFKNQSKKEGSKKVT